MTKETTPEEILREHLPYELDMLRATFEKLRAGVAADAVVQNALIESFSIHARSLIDFFNNAQGVPASSFTDGGYTPFPTGTVRRALVTKLNTQVAHLTLERTADPASKIGDTDRQELLDKIHLALQEFEQHLKPEYRGIWTYEIERRAVLIPPQSAASTNVVGMVQAGRGAPGDPSAGSTTTARTTSFVPAPNTIVFDRSIKRKPPTDDP